jgi:exodeoxyribonuclease VII large subunit
MSKQIFTLLQVAASIRKTLENRYQQSYWVRAELYKMNLFASGHAFPELVQREDGKIVANLTGVIWRTHFERIKTHFEKTVQEPLSEGKELLLEIKIVFSETYGLSLHILDIDATFSLGALHQLRLNTLKQLHQEGLLNKNQQLSLSLPKRIALISAESSKGLSDFIEVLLAHKDRFGIATFLFNSTLQGDAAIDSIIGALEKIHRVRRHFDAVAIVRGGGAEVGMSCYDDFRLCKKIAEFPLPVLCGIGHSTNLTVAEMVSYSHAITPSVLASNLLNAFEKALSEIDQNAVLLKEIFEKIHRSNHRLINQMSVKITRITRQNLAFNAQTLNQLTSRVHLGPRASLDRNQKSLLYSPLKLNQALKNITRIHAQHLQSNFQKMQHCSSQLLLFQNHKINSMMKEIALLDPKSVLARGFSIVRKEQHIIRSSTALSSGEQVTLEFFEGSSEATIN